MAMSFSQIQTMASYLLDDLSFGYFTTAQVQFWINNAQREVQKRLLQAPGNWYVKRAQTNTVYGQNDYVLPSDFRKIHRVELVLGGTPPNETKSTVEIITVNESDLMPNGIGTASGAYITQNILSIFPAPDVSGQTLRIYYSYLVADMANANDIPDCPYEYQEMIGLLAARDGFIKDQRDPTPLDMKIGYYEKLMKEDAEQRNMTRGRSIVTSQGNAYVSVF